MSFFESIPRPPAPEPVRWHRPAWMRSDAVIPGSVPLEAVLIRTEQVAVAVGSVRAYPNGFEFTVHVRLHSEDETGWVDHADPFHWHRPRRGVQGDDERLRLGILYADGRRAATTGESHPPSDDDDDDRRLVLCSRAGAGAAAQAATGSSGCTRCRRMDR